MTDVAGHADTSSDDGRRHTRSHRTRRAQRGMRVPGAPPTTAGTDEGARFRHRRAPGTAPFVVPAASTAAATPRNRHHAADATEAFDAGTVGEQGTGRHTGGHAVVTGARSTASRPRHRPDPAADPVTAPIVTVAALAAANADDGTALTAVTTATSTGRHAAVETAAIREAPAPAPAPAPAVPEEPTVLAAVASEPATGSHRAPRKKGLPLRATIGLIGGGGVAALFALTTPGSPLPASGPNDPQPSVAAPAGLFDSVLPSTPDTTSPSSVVPVSPSEITTTTPTEEGPQPVIGALFDAASGAFSRLFDNSANDGLVENGPRPKIVANPDDPGRQAWQFSLGPGGKRSEVLPKGPGTEPTDGDEQYIRYTAHLSDDFPTDTGNWQVILQWHHTSPNGSPPLALQVTRGQLYMVSEGDDMQAIGPVSPGQRIDLTMRVRFAQDPSEGSVTVWRDGRPTGVTNWSPRDGTMSTRQAYLKMGMYRAQAIRENGSIIVTDLKIGRDAEGIGGIGPRRAD
ncbi:polysaccharide lyase-like protein [Actinomycetospora succinea]|uniref:Polysaccharide lyase-like protein n=1 Tax=Actinomycetospora succinea TaxID=663603 RepID=A0A4R6UP39_9PSEU|nr:heparin lyase I family protein [Actinomycetospora succinea]TDQ48940.1 polysaccharide lyase-like protein [Actinomycetospora succinea]